MLTVSNATLSNLQNTSVDRKWTFTLTPAADGAVEVTLPASSVQLAPGGFNRWNLAATYSATADLGAPTVVWRGFSSTKVRNNQFGPYNDGDQIDMTVTFSEHVTVTGAPYIRVRINTRDVQLAYQSGSGTATLVFRYTIPSGFPSTRRNPMVQSDSIEIPSGASIVDSGGTALAGMLPPQITLMTRSLPLLLASETDDGVMVGDQEDWVMTYDRPVTVTQAAGAAKAYVRIRGKKQDDSFINLQAVYVSGSGTRNLTFRYTVVAADLIASDSGFSLLANHVHMPNGFNIQDASGVDAATQQGSYSILSTARERTRVQIPFVLGSSTPEVRIYHFTSGIPRLMTVSPTSLTVLGTTDDPTAWQQQRMLIATLHGDSDAERNIVALIYRIETENAFLSGRISTWRLLTVLDDDPEIDSLTAASASIAEGESARFEVYLTEAPPSEGRKVLATITERGDCLPPSLIDADGDAPGVQQEIELYTSEENAAGILSLATVDDEIGEADCVVTAALTPPDPTNPMSFALASGASSLQQSVTVRDDDGGPPEAPASDPIRPGAGDDSGEEDPLAPVPQRPPKLAAQTIVEGEAATGEFDISVNHRPDADIELYHLLRPTGLIEGSPDPVVFIRNDWKRNQAWTLTALQDADSDDEQVRWGLRVASDDEQWHSLAVERVTLTVRDDDPQVAKLAAAAETIVEGETAVFRLQLSREPLDEARTVRATLWAPGATLAADLADADPEAAGLQLDVELSGVLEVATVGDEVDGPDGLLILSVAQPLDYLSANYFTLAGGAAHFTATVRVLDDDEPLAAAVESEIEEEPVEAEPVAEEEEEPVEEGPAAFPNTGNGGLLLGGRAGAARQLTPEGGGIRLQRREGESGGCG